MVFGDPDVERYKDKDSEEEIELHGIYFDTKDKRLSREGITFRTRKEGERFVATIKWNGVSENGLYEREEINIPICDESKFRNPDVELFKHSQMYDTLKEVIGERELLARVEAKLTRKQVRIDTGKSISEISYDFGLAINGDSSCQISEMEIELYSGDRQDMEEFSEKLAEKYHLMPENRSKYRQGLELEK